MDDGLIYLPDEDRWVPEDWCEEEDSIRDELEDEDGFVEEDGDDGWPWLDGEDRPYTLEDWYGADNL